MVNQGTVIDDVGADFRRDQALQTPKEACLISGRFWDEETQTCLPVKPTEPTTPQKTANLETGEITTAGEVKPITKLSTQERRLAEATGQIIQTDPLGNETILTDEQRKSNITQTEKLQASQEGVGASVAQRAANLAQQQAAAGGALVGQVGRGQTLGISPTGLNYLEAGIQGVVDGIPRGLMAIGGAATTGGILGGILKGGAAGAIRGAPTGNPALIGGLAIAGSALAALGSISGSMKSNLAGQRRDTTTAQQRVLDEGKQTMQDWVTLAANDPKNRAFYLGEYNKVTAQIDQAHRQMKLDTSRDLLKFETALPNLAEFNAFYAPAGERDALNAEMRIALQTVEPDSMAMLDLAIRRGDI